MDLKTRFRSQVSIGKTLPLLLVYPAIPEGLQGQGWESIFRPLLTPDFHTLLSNVANQRASGKKETS